MRLGIVGHGAMGARHARVAAGLPNLTLAAVVEPDGARAAGLTCPVFSDVTALRDRVDAAVIAVPTALHATLAVPLLEAGIACLIEKPFVATAAEAQRLDAAARAGGTLYRVGHVERFNPAVDALFAARPQDIRAVSARRISGASARVTDIDVVLDLMVHDLDVVLALMAAPVARVAAAGDRDHVTASLTFADGRTAALIASRVPPVRLRDLDVFATEAAWHVDYIAKTLTVSRRRDEAFVATPQAVPAQDALAAQLAAFLAAVQNGGRGGVTPAEALAVMETAWRIQAALAA